MSMPRNLRLIIEYEYEGEIYHSVTNDVTTSGPDVVVFNRELKDKIVACIGARSQRGVKGNGADWPADAKLGRPEKGPYRPGDTGAAASQTRGGDPPIGEVCWHDPLCTWFCIDE